MKDVFILIGSNKGDRKSIISNALSMIGERAGEIITASAIYETEPWGFQAPITFLNQVISLETTLTPEKLLDQLLTIEVQLGRIRPFDGCGCSVPSVPGAEGHQLYESRSIDLDILFYGQQLVFTDALMIPHPRLHERKFTLIPLMEIAPGFQHPLLKKSVEYLCKICPDQSAVRAYSGN